MRHFSFLIFTGICFFLMQGMPCMLSAQSLKTFVKEAEKSFEAGDYAMAAIYYRKGMNIDSSMLDIDYKYAEVSRLILDYQQAEKWYGYVFKRDKGKKFPLASFWFASMLKNNGKYKEAKQNFDKYYKKNNPKKKEDYYTKKSFYEISACDYALLLKSQPKPIKIQHPDSVINSIYGEFAPVQIDSNLYYSSIRPAPEGEVNKFSSNIYMSAQSKADWKKSGLYELSNSTPEISNLNFTADRKRVFYTQCEQTRGKSQCEIYTATLSGNEITGIERLGEEVNAPGSNNTQPFIEERKGKGRILYFVSDREGGQGKLDIWAAKFNEKNECEKASNLGKLINSPDDEVTPYVDIQSGSLYFSSDWHKGMGGFDIFKTDRDSTGLKWKEPVNMGAPLNSSYNDLYYSINNNLGNGFFVSNRPGSYTDKSATCCNDIYYYHVERKDKGKETKELSDEIKIDASKEIQLLVPITLYFHNDEPEPRTRKNSTPQNYLKTYHDYLALKLLYRREYAKGLKDEKIKEAEEDIEDFFAENVEKGEEDLEKFSELLIRILREGRDVSITLKGYCSPLASTEYNVNLARRRLSSLRNYFEEYKDGILRPYILHTDPSLARINFTDEEIGELEASPFVSDNPNDIRNSIYSRSAAFERKIQIIAVSPKDKKDK